MATYNSVKDYEKAISKALQALATDNSFIDDLKMLLHKAIYDKVYSAPEGEYKRRYDEGGLGDKRTYSTGNYKGGMSDVEVDDEGFIIPTDIDIEDIFTTDVLGESAITITLKADANPQHPAQYDLDYMVEYGKGKGNMAVPRPFYKTAEAYVDKMASILSDSAATFLEKYL